MIYIYDIETYVNFFCVTFKRVDDHRVMKCVIYKQTNDLDKLYNFLDNNKNKWLVGYNSKYFDNPILNYIYKNYDIFSILNSDILTENIYNFALSIINNNPTEYKYQLPFNSIDLMRVGNVEKKSLKLVAVNLNWPLIQDLPFKVDKIIQDNEIDEIIKYNLNDVEITEKLYHKLKKDIDVRWEISQKYNLNLMSESDSGMANRLMEKMYSDISGIPIKDLKEMRTERKIIHYENIIFDDIYFHSPILKDFLQEIKSQTWYKSQPYFNKSIIYNGVKYKLGIGGIHSDDKPGLFEETSEHRIIDCDITSMYPSLMIKHNLFPAHLSNSFIDLYKKIIDQRIEAKNSNKKTEAYVLKILVNSVFGKTLYDKHWLYDPLVGLRVTINGQLYMLMLIEHLVENNFQVISANTDGLVTIVPNNKFKEYKETCCLWENKTGFNLEYTEYLKYIRKDVNNYITIKKDNSVKEKGDFLQFEKLSLRQGIDKPIISKALYNYFVNSIPIEQTIYEEQDIYTFCIAKKVDAKFVNEFHVLKDNIHIVEELQKSVRFYISTNGGTLYKVDKNNNKYISYCINRRISILNNNKNNKNIKDYNIDYGYYISETRKIIDIIDNPQLTLW